MKTFTIGASLSFDVTRHLRIDGSKLPVPDPDYVVHAFRVVARWDGAPILVEWFAKMGKKVLPVYSGGVQVGTKPGADFRSWFWKAVARRVGKIIRGQQLGKTFGQVTEADIASAGTSLRNLLRGAFTDPADLKTLSLDDAWRFLRDAAGDAEEGDKMPGTTLGIEVTFDSEANWDGSSYTTASTTSTLTLRFDTAPAASNAIKRAQLRFPVTGIAAGSTLTDSDLQLNKIAETVEAGEDINVHAYNNTGDDDPEADAAQARYDRSIGGSALVQLVGNGTGSVTADLGVTADGQIEGNISSPGFYAIGLANDVDWDDAEDIDIESIENAGTDPATLTVVYTEPAGGTTGAGWYGAPGGVW